MRKEGKGNAETPGPAGGLSGGANPVTFSGTYSAETSAPGLSIQMKWGAAAYPSFRSNYNTLQVKAGNKTACGVNNSDHAGTPEGSDNNNNSWKSFVIGGARGGGGSNFTGSWSGTLKINICPSGDQNKHNLDNGGLNRQPLEFDLSSPDKRLSSMWVLVRTYQALILCVEGLLFFLNAHF